MDKTRRPPDVNEALSSMLWTPYNRTPSVTSTDTDSDTSTYIFPTSSNSTYNNESIYIPINLIPTTKPTQNRMANSFSDNFTSYQIKPTFDSPSNRFSNDFTFMSIPPQSTSSLTSSSFATIRTLSPLPSAAPHNNKILLSPSLPTQSTTKLNSSVSENDSNLNNENVTTIYIEDTESNYPIVISSNSHHHLHHPNYGSQHLSLLTPSIHQSASTSSTSNLNYYRTVPVKIDNDSLGDSTIENEVNINSGTDNHSDHHHHHRTCSISSDNHCDLIRNSKIKPSHFGRHDRSDYRIINNHQPWISSSYHPISVFNSPFMISPMVTDAMPVPIRRTTSERSTKGCCGQWFAGPPLRALIGVVALGGVACAMGGAAVGISGLSGPPTSHLTAALLMIGVGVILVTVSGAAWHMTAPGVTTCFSGFNMVTNTRADLSRRFSRRHERRNHPSGIVFPEYSHRLPPPSYQASMSEQRLNIFMEHSRMRVSPPPAYNVETVNRIFNWKNDILPS